MLEERMVKELVKMIQETKLWRSIQNKALTKKNRTDRSLVETHPATRYRREKILLLKIIGSLFIVGIMGQIIIMSNKKVNINHIKTIDIALFLLLHLGWNKKMCGQ